MSLEMDIVEATRARRARLWGKPVKASKPTPPPVPDKMLEPEPVITELPKPKSLDTDSLPKPTKEQLEEIFEDDDAGYKEGLKLILKSYGENMRRLVSHQRDAHIVECRIAVAKYLRNRGWSYPRIGQLMRRDHTSILYLISPDLKKARYAKNTAARYQAQRAWQRLDELTNHPAAILGADGIYRLEGSHSNAQPGTGAQEGVAGTGE